jgi:hypothetical protein
VIPHLGSLISYLGYGIWDLGSRIYNLDLRSGISDLVPRIWTLESGMSDMGTVTGNLGCGILDLECEVGSENCYLRSGIWVPGSRIWYPLGKMWDLVCGIMDRGSATYNQIFEIRNLEPGL